LMAMPVQVGIHCNYMVSVKQILSRTNVTLDANDYIKIWQ